ncbi:MAG: tetratricopeptide repeat protein [Lachnoclostridium sp.]|nr:tetratricopeptide repeat protein [Lachnoclostridium sp.]
MRKFIISVAATLMAVSPIKADVSSSVVADQMTKAEIMFENDDYQACVDLLTTLPEDEVVGFYRAVSMLRLGSADGVEQAESWLEDYPVSTRRYDVFTALGDYYFAQGKYSEALIRYEMVDLRGASQPVAAACAFHKAYCYLVLGEHAEAAGLYAGLVNDRTYGNDSRFYLAYTRYLDKDYDAALKGFESVDQSREPSVAAPYYIAQIYFQKGDFNKALSMAKKLIATGAVPQFLPECNRIAGESLYNLGSTDEALPYLWKYCAEATNPEPGAFYILGASEWRAGNADNAIKLLQRAIGTHSAMEQSAYLMLGQAYAARGDNSSALMAFENAYRVDYDRQVRETAFYNYAVARMEGGRVPFGNSVALLDDFLSEYPDSRYAADVQRYIINGYMTDNDYESAIAAINRIASPTDNILRAKQRALFVLGTREYSAGNISSALTRFKQAAAVTAGDKSITTQCAFWLGDCHYRQGNYAEAVAQYRRYLAAAPAGKSGDYNRRLAQYDLGYALFADEDYNAALEAFKKALKGSADDAMTADIYCRIADCNYYLKNVSAAADYYAKAYDLNRAAGDYALFQLAVMKGLLKDHKGKIQLIDNLMDEYPSSGLLPSAMLEKAESLMALSHTSDAVATYNILIEKYPLTAQGRNGMLQLAITYLNGGDRDRARATYRKVITTYPTSEEARLAADDLKKIYAADGALDEYAGFINSVPDAPAFDPSEMEQLAFSAAENDFINKGLTDKLTRFISDYPRSTRLPQATYYIAEAAWNEGDASEALKLASNLVAKYPDAEVVEDALLIKGNAEAAVGKTEPALETFTMLESKASSSNMLREARQGIMSTALALNRWEQVVSTADKMLTSTAAASTADAEIRFMRAYALNSLKKYDEAYAEWKALAANTDDVNGAKSAYYLGQSQYDRGLYKAAAETADKMISSNPPHRYWLARGFILYSDALRAQGNEFEADEYLKSLKANYPGSEADIFKMINSRLK